MLEIFSYREIIDLLVFAYMFLLIVYEYENRRYKWIDVIAMVLLCFCAGCIAYCAVFNVQIKQLTNGSMNHILFLVVFAIEFVLYWGISWKNVKQSRREAKIKREQNLKKLEDIEKNV